MHEFRLAASRVAVVSVVDGGWAGGLVGAGSQSVEKLIGRVEDRSGPAGRPVKFDLLLALLPLRRPLPPLIGVALDARSKQNAVADDFSLEFVTVVQARGKPKFPRQRHPTADSDPRQHHDITGPVLLTPAVRAPCRRGSEVGRGPSCQEALTWVQATVDAGIGARRDRCASADS